MDGRRAGAALVGALLVTLAGCGGSVDRCLLRAPGEIDDLRTDVRRSLGIPGQQGQAELVDPADAIEHL
jgi:hypothetical protein